MQQLYNFFLNTIKNTDPERVHHAFSGLLKLFPELGSNKLFTVNPSRHHKVYLPHSQLTFRNPLMLAAGFDKDGHNLDFFNHLGLGGMEIGTITVRPQAGNPKPRIWRKYQEKALNNSMGFPSIGMHQVKENLLNRTTNKNDFTIGINIGKNKNTPLEAAWEEYQTLLDYFVDQANYFTINISSPNTKGLRDLFKPENFNSFIRKLNSPKPIFLKLSPDLENGQLLKVIKSSLELNSSVKGFVLSNTSSPLAEKGGYSGPKLYPILKEAIKSIHQHFNGNYPFDLIACGGLKESKQLEELRALNVPMFQFYTAFIFQGPSFFKSL